MPRLLQTQVVRKSSITRKSIKQLLAMATNYIARAMHRMLIILRMMTVVLGRITSKSKPKHSGGHYFSTLTYDRNHFRFLFLNERLGFFF